jgi:hypothetical protein
VTTANDPAAATPEAATQAELEAVLDGLFRGPRERFVSERNAAAQRLRTRGRKEAAAWLKALARPSISAWAVNQLWWTARAEVEALLDASRHLAEAIRSGAGPAAQAAAGQARRRALEALIGAASDVLAAAGQATGMGTLRKVSTTLEAVAAHAALGLGEGVPAIGRLTEDLDPPGFELVVGLGAGASIAASGSPAPESVVLAEPRGSSEADAVVATAERERDAANVRVGEAARVLDEATRAADEAVLQAQQAVEAHGLAQARAEAARQLADEAERAALRAQAEARRERERVDVAREVLARSSAELERRTEALVRARQRLGVLGPGRG